MSPGTDARQSQSPRPPPGWYDDPERSGEKRYWDGAQWTEQHLPPPPAEPPQPAQPVFPAGWYDDPERSGEKRYWDGAQWTEQHLPAPPVEPPEPAEQWVAEPAVDETTTAAPETAEPQIATGSAGPEAEPAEAEVADTEVPETEIARPEPHVPETAVVPDVAEPTQPADRAAPTSDAQPRPEGAGRATKQDGRWSTKLSADQQEKFFAHLDSLPNEERPRFAFMGRKSGVWHQLGGGTAQVIVLVYEDWIVLSTRGMANAKKEKKRVVRPLSDLTDTHVVTGPVFSSVQFRFRDGSKTKITNVDHAAAERMAAFPTEELAAFDRSRLSAEAVTDFWTTCMFAVPLPDDLFE